MNNIYIASTFFCLVHLPITLVALYFLKHSKPIVFKGILLTSIGFGIYMQGSIGNHLLLSLVATLVFCLKRKRYSIPFLLLTWLVLNQMEFIKTLTLIHFDVRIPSMLSYKLSPILTGLFVGNLMLYQPKKQTYIDFLITSSLGLLWVFIPLNQLSTVTFDIKNTDFRKGMVYLSVGLAFHLLFFVPFNHWTSIGLHSTFSLNFVQTWFVFIFNGFKFIALFISITCFTLGLCSIFYTSYSMKEVKSIFKWIQNEFFFQTTQTKNIYYFLGGISIIILSGNSWFHVLISSPLLLLMLYARNRKSRIFKILTTLSLFTLALTLSLNSLHEIKTLFSGLLSLHTLFYFYNELYIIFSLQGNFILFAVLLFLFPLIIKKRWAIHHFLIGSDKKYYPELVFILIALAQIQ